MPVAPVDNHGTHLYFEDTGREHLGEQYLTIVAVHGTGFNCAIFERMLPFAASCSLRLVLVNRRDYRGSSPLSADDVELLTSTDDAKRLEYFRRRAFEFCEFLAWFVQENGIPPNTTTRDGHVEGGIVVLGWSSAYTTLVGMLAFADRVPEATRRKLEPYLRAFVLHDVPLSLFGFDVPPLYHPLRDPTLDYSEGYKKFTSWVSSYFAHPDIWSGDVKTLADQPIEGSPTTLGSMTQEERDHVLQMDTNQAEGHVFSMPPAIYLGLTERMLDKSTGDVWPRCKVKLLWSEQSVWEILAGAWQMKKLYERKCAKGTAGRVLELASQVHWDKPQLLCQALASELSK
ncbi:hypothetical protein DENSPDRAFT_872166 [Dentipellis sp. KUC8613]|nr:hypothetical protein DENSPDRAFT_872166 [Dentipellis sp. KUC8613]